jgi:hypothetical protein
MGSRRLRPAKPIKYETLPAKQTKGKRRTGDKAQVALSSRHEILLSPIPCTSKKKKKKKSKAPTQEDAE